MVSPADSAFRKRRASARTDLRAEALQSWFAAAKGWLNPHVQVLFDHTHGFHAVAAQPLASPVVASCPLSLTLSHLSLRRDHDLVPHVASPLHNCLGRVPDHVLNYLFLAEQHCLGEESQWHPYIACLPKSESMAAAVWFTDRDMELLRGTNLMQATRDRQTALRDQWEHAQAIMNECGVVMPEKFDL